MFILNAGLSHKSKDWLMNSTTEICEDKERVKLRKEMLVQSKLEHYFVFGWDIGLQLSCEHKNLTRPFSSPNHSNNGEVRICPAARTLFSVWPISRVLEVQITSIFFPGKLSHFPTTFMFYRGPSSDGSIFVLFRQEDKDFHQVKSWPPTQQVFIKSIIPNFGL